MENNVYDEQENCNRGIGSFQNTHDAGLDEGVFHVKQLASRNSLSLARHDPNDIPSILSTVATSVGGLRQELKQLGSSSSGSSTQQLLSTSGFNGAAAGELLDPLHGFSARLSTPIRRNTLGYSGASASRRSSLGYRMQQPAWETSSVMGTVPEGYGMKQMEERIYARMVSALKTVAAQRTVTTNSAAGQVSEAATWGSPLPQRRPGELGTAAAADALNAQCQDETPTASTVAAAMQELAAATGAERLAQQLQERVQQLEQEVQDLKQNVTTHISSQAAGQQTMQQLQEQQSEVQQQLMLEARTWQNQSRLQQDQLRQQQDLAAALTADVRELQQQQRPPTPVLQELLADLRHEAQQQIALMGKQQEERIDDLTDELLHRIEGLQLRLQSVEDEQERLGERQQQQRRSLQQLQASVEQQERERRLSSSAATASVASASIRQVASGRQRVCASADGAAAPGYAHSDSGTMCTLPPGFALPEMASMIPTSISEPEAQHSARRSSSTHTAPTSILEQQPLRQQPSATNSAAGLDVPRLSESQDGRNSQLASEVAELSERVCALEEQQKQAEGMSARLQEVEEQLGAAAPLDAMTCGAVEARLSVLEDDSNERKQQLQAAQEQVAEVCAQLECLQQQLDSTSLQQQLQEQRPTADPTGTDIAARVATLEAQQQELRDLAQRLEAVQQQYVSGDGSSVLLDSQPSSVKERIQQFEEQLNAAIRRFAPGHLGSRHNSEGGTAGAAAEGGKNPGREASLRELLAALQADVEHLQSKAPSTAGENSATSCCTDASSGSAAAEDAGFVLAGQLQQQLAKLTQNCAELGEAVLQLDLQLQQVEGNVKQQSQQTLTATQSATAATYISKEAAHEIERVVLQVQQLAAAVKMLSSKDTAAEGAAPAAATSAAPADSKTLLAPASDSAELAKQLQLLEDSVQQLKQQVEDSMQQLQAQAELQNQHTAEAKQLAQQLADHQQQAAAAAAVQQQQLDSLLAAQRQYEQQQQNQRTAAHEQDQKLTQVSTQCEQQQAAVESLQQQCAQHEVLLQQLQDGSEAWADVKQRLHQLQELAIGCASADAVRAQEVQLSELQGQLQKLSEASADALLQLAQVQAQAAAPAASAEVQGQLSKLQEQLTQQVAQADEQSGLLFSLRVDLQNGLQELGERLQGVEGLRGDMEILEDSRKAAAARTEVAAAEALEKVENMMASLAEQQGQQAGADAGGSADMRAELAQLQQQLQPVSEQLAAVQQQVLDVQQELTAHMQGAHALAVEHQQLLQKQLETCNQQVQEQQQQLAPLAEQLADLQLQMFDVKQECAEQAKNAHAAVAEQQQALQQQLETCSQQVQQLQEQQKQMSPLAEQLVGLQQQVLDVKQECSEQVQAAQAVAGEQQQALRAQVDQCSGHLQQLLKLQQALVPLPEQLTNLNQQVLQLKEEHSAQTATIEQEADLHQQLAACCDQLQQLQEQQQQAQLQAEQIQQQFEQNLSEMGEGLQAQLLSHGSDLQQHTSQLQEQEIASAQLQEQVQQAAQALAELRQQESMAQQQAPLHAVQQQLEALQQQLQGDVSQQLAQLTKQVEELQGSAAGQAGSQQAYSAQLDALQQQLQEVQQQLGEGEAPVQAQLQDAEQQRERLQQQFNALKAQAAQAEQLAAEQLVNSLRPLQEQQATVTQLVEQQQAATAAQQEQLSQCDQQMQALLSQVAAVQQQQAQQQGLLLQQQQQAQAAAEQAQLLQQLQSDLSALCQQQRESAALADERQQMEQELEQGLQQTLAEQLHEVQAQLQQHAGQFADVQQRLAELSSKAHELPEAASVQQVQQLQGKLQEVQQTLRQQDKQLQDRLQQQAQELQEQLSKQLQQSEALLQKQDASRTAAQHTQQLQQHQERLEHLQQRQDQQRTLLVELKHSQAQHTSQLQDVTHQQAQQQTVLQGVQVQVQQGINKWQDLAKQQEKQQQGLSDVQQQQDQGAQKLQQLQEKVEGLGPTVEKAAADAEAAHSIAADAEKEVRELREDLEEALGFMAPFLSPAASSLTSPGATPFVSPHARAAAAGLYEGFAAASHAQSPFGAPGASYSVNPVGAGMPGYSVTIDIGTQLPGRPIALMPGQQLALQNSLQALQQQQQQQGLLDMPSSAAASRRVSAQDSAAALPAVYTPLSAGLWRPEPHQVAVNADGIPAAAAAAAAEGGSAAAACDSTSAVTAGTGALARFDAQVTPGSSANKLTRCASLDSPSFRAAATAGVTYGPTPPSHPSTGSRPFRGQLAGSAAKEDGLGVYVTPGGAGSAGRTGGSSAGRLLRTLSLDSPSFVAAATAGMVYDRTPLQSANGAQRAEAGSASRLTLSVNASDAALRLFDAWGDVADEGAAAGGFSTAGAAQQQLQQLQLPEEDDSPEQHKQRGLPGGVVASALLRAGSNLQRASHSTAEGIGSQRSSAVWSARDSAVFDNSLYNTPKKRRKSRAADAAGTPGSTMGCAAAVTAAAAGTPAGASDDASDASSDSGESHSGLVSLTASLTALQLQRLQQQAGILGGVAVPPFGESPPITPTSAAGGAFDVSSPATTATPVSVYKNAMYEDDRDKCAKEVQLPAGAFSGGGQGAPRALRLSGHSPVGAVAVAAAAAAVTPAGQVRATDTARTSTASSSANDGFVTPTAAAVRGSGLVAESSAEDAAAAAVAAGRTLSPAEAVATVRSLAASATPPSLGSWQKKRQQRKQEQQAQQESQCIPEQGADAQQLGVVSGAAAVAAQSSCNFAAGQANGDSPVMLPHGSTAWQHQQQQETPCLAANRTVARKQGVTESSIAQGEAPAEQPQQKQPTAVLSAELLLQHTQQQQSGSNTQLPWLQQQQEAAGTHAGPLSWHASAAAAAAAAATPREQRVSPAGTPEAVLSPMLSELMSLGADVIDLDGSEADSDLLAVTPDRTCSRTGPTGAAAAAAAAVLAGAAAEGISKQLTFEEAADGDAEVADGEGGEGGSAGQECSGSVVIVSLSGQQAADASSVQQQQGYAGECNNSMHTPHAAAGPADAPGSGAEAAGSTADAQAEEEPVLRLKGGGGFEPHHEHDLQGEDPADGQLSGDDSFDLADYDSSDGEGGSGSDGYWEAWELVQAPGAHNNAAASSAAKAAGAAGTISSAASADTAAGSTAPRPTAGSAATAAGDSGTATAAATAAAKRPPIPPGWLRALPIDWRVGAAPPDAYRVALRTSSKSGSGTKTRATVVLTGMGGSIVCEHKLGGGRKRCSYTPGSTVQDWLFLQHSTVRSSSAGGASSSSSSSSRQSTTVPPAAAAGAGQLHVPGVSQVAVRHDAAGFSGAWLLECVIVQHLKSGDWWQFDNRSGWIKGTQQAKAVVARDAGAAAERQEAEGTASSAGERALRQLQLSASGVAANCPLVPMPRSSPSSSGGAAVPRKQAAAIASQTPPPQQQQQQSSGIAASSSSSAQAPASALGTTSTAVSQAVSAAAAAATAAVALDDDGSTVSKGGFTINCQPGSFVPLDDVELKLRGSLRASRSRSCSPSPSHRARQQQQQQQPQQQPIAVQGGASVTAAMSEVASLRSIAAMVSRAAAPAAAATAAAWDTLGSRRSSAGELRYPAARRVSGSVAPAKIVPLLAARGSSSSEGASEDGYRASSGAGGSTSAAAAAAAAAVGGVAGTAGAGDAQGGTGLTCRVSRTLTHSSGGTPCRLVHCNSSYLGRTSSSNARQLQEQEQQRGVHFLEWAEQVEFDAAAAQNRRNGPGSSGTSSSSSIQSFTEEQLLEAQGGWEFVRPPDASSSYTTLIDSQLPTAAGSAAAGSSRAAGAPVTSTSAAAAANTPLPAAVGSSGELQEVPLSVAKPASLLNAAKGGGSEYQLRIQTADKIGAALPAGQHVYVEVLGSTGALLTTQLPRPKGSFLRGSYESFSLSSAAGDIGRIEAVRVWHEPGGGSIGGSWCLHKLEVEAVFRGATYVFAKSPPECWVAKGAEKAVVLRQPKLLRSDEQAALVAEASELQRQLDSNTSLEEGDKAVLAARLQKLQLRLMHVGIA